MYREKTDRLQETNATPRAKKTQYREHTEGPEKMGGTPFEGRALTNDYNIMETVEKGRFNGAKSKKNGSYSRIQKPPYSTEQPHERTEKARETPGGQPPDVSPVTWRGCMERSAGKDPGRKHTGTAGRPSDRARDRAPRARRACGLRRLRGR